MAKYIKVDLVDKILELATEAAQENGTKKPSKKAISQFIDHFAEAVRTLVVDEGDSLLLQGFNKWEKYESKPTNKRNPQTGEIIQIPAKVRTRSKAYFE